MIVIFIKILITLLEVIVLYAAYYLGKKNPTMITGFKWGVSAEEINEDKRWLKRYQKAMKGNVGITLLGGILASFATNSAVYISVLVIPTVIVVIYLSITQPKGGRRL